MANEDFAELFDAAAQSQETELIIPVSGSEEESDAMGLYLISDTVRTNSLSAIDKIFNDGFAEYTDVLRATSMLAKLEKVNLEKRRAIELQEMAERNFELRAQQHEDRMELDRKRFEQKVAADTANIEIQKDRLAQAKAIAEIKLDRQLEYRNQKLISVAEEKDKHRQMNARLHLELQSRKLEYDRVKEEQRRQDAEERLKAKRLLQLELKDKAFDNQRDLIADREQAKRGPESPDSRKIEVKFTNTMAKRIEDASKNTGAVTANGPESLPFESGTGESLEAGAIKKIEAHAPDSDISGSGDNQTGQ